MTIHKNLRQLRLNRGMTQGEVAEKLNITRQALSSYESGRTYPDIDMLLKLSDIYGTDLYGIIYGQERLLKSVSRVKTIANILFVLLAVLTFISSALLWSINRFFPLSEGVVSAEEMVILNSRLFLSDAWTITDNLILIISFLGFALLFILLISEKGMVPLKLKLKYVATLSVVMLSVAIIFGLIDPIYAVTQYIATPVLVIFQLTLFLLVELIISNRKTGEKHI